MLNKFQIKTISEFAQAEGHSEIQRTSNSFSKSVRVKNVSPNGRSRTLTVLTLHTKRNGRPVLTSNELFEKLAGEAEYLFNRLNA